MPTPPHAPRPARATLVEGAPPPAGTSAAPVARIALTRPSLRLGRLAADVRLDSPAVSSLHAVLERTPQGWALRDAGSMNGVHVGGARVSRVTLGPGVAARIGPFVLTVEGDELHVADLRGSLRLDARGLGKRVGGGKWILRDVSLSILPRELVALVGGSGAGKTTLMKALAGWARPTTGRVLLNGADAASYLDAFRSVIGYVPQDDILHRDLPVRRALAYTARLRLPPDTPRAERAARVERALADVEMTEHAGKRVSDLSGGQRKRVSIAAELLADPALFFLDEPTSGLDPGLEKKMMHTLRRLSDAGRTVVLVTHSTASLDLCDAIAFVAGGRLVYFGPPAAAAPFFRVASGDLADVYAKLEGRADAAHPERLAVARADLAPELDLASRQGHAAPALADLWEQRFRASPGYAALVAARLGHAPTAEGSQARRPRRVPRASRLRQLAILTQRYLDLTLQDRKNLLLLLLQAPVIAWLMTLVAKPDALVGARVRVFEVQTVLFMLATVAVWFGVINAAREITKESAILRRERMAGLSVLPYLGSKLLVLGLLVIVQSLGLLAVLSTKVTLPTAGLLFDARAELLVTTALAATAGLSLGLCVSAAAKTADRAISFVPLVLIPQILFSGVLFPLGSDTSTIRVLSWLTISRWATDAYATSAHLTRLTPGRLAAPEYAFTAANLVQKWQILGGYAAVCLLLALALTWARDRAD